MARAQTPNDVIRRGIALTGIHPANEDMPATYLMDGLSILNDILDEWGGFGIYIPYQSELSFSLTPGKKHVVVSNRIPSDIQAAELIHILQATIDTFELDLLSESQHLHLLKNAVQRPTGLLLRRFPNYSQLIFDAVPDKAYTIHLLCKQRLLEVDLFQQFDQVPAHYWRALTYQIAVDFAAMVGASLSPTIENRAEKMVLNLLASNIPDLTIKTERAL
ncbi:MAG: hypothetical protein A3F10_05640 [Coxiella sp. RIFCSPHIGHO2_12_FULL_42_15]|nr:MAG: hypothetical protein A3F10_05640 [Coxiella sp. RIFCSPHIGHO2_12_FULL_42_15]